MQEAQLYNFWEHYARSGQVLSWQGNVLQVLQAGTLNEHNGPDIQFARFKLNDIIYQGAVEFHLHINDWYKHHHHYDPAYQDVVLHIVAVHPGNVAFVEHNLSQRLIPTFMIKKPALPAHQIMCTEGTITDSERLTAILQELALERLKLKVLAYSKSLKECSEHSVFYQNFMRILGYPFNKNIFEILARKVPAAVYEYYKQTPIVLMSIYFGCAGFLEGTFKDAYALKLQNLFCRYAPEINSSVLSRNQWQMAATRPVNHPHFRIAAWVSFLSLLQKQSPLYFIYSLMSQRLEYRKMYQDLHDILMLKTKGYWQVHFVLGNPPIQKKNKYFLGNDRINELITNLIIPICISKAQKNNNLGFVSYLQDFFLWMPGKCSYGSLFRKSPWMKQYQNIWQSCNTGQALLHLNDVYCLRGRCYECPLGRIKQI